MRLAAGLDGGVFSVNNMLHIVRYSAEGSKISEWGAPESVANITVGPEGQVYLAYKDSPFRAKII